MQDWQGSTRALTNGSGTITDTYSYTAFGELFNQTGSTTNSYLYTGQQYDSFTGLYSLRARYYNPALGRFLSQDTYPVSFSNPVELNRYVYTANNPINAMDPSGHLFVEFDIQTEEHVKAKTALYVYVGSPLKYYFTRLAFFVGVPLLILLLSSIDVGVGVGVGTGIDIGPGTQTTPQTTQQPTPPSPTPSETPTKKPNSSFDIAFGRVEYLPVFAGMLSHKLKRSVLPFNFWGEEGLSASPPATSLPHETLVKASQYIGGAVAWSSRFPEAQYPEAKIRFNLWGIELGYKPRITLGEYYLLKRLDMLSRRTVFYEYTHTNDDLPFPEPLTGEALTNRLLQIESSPNYRTLELSMLNHGP